VFIFRVLCWISLVSLFVPYNSIDVPHARFSVDGQVFLTNVSTLSDYCRDSFRGCRAAQELVQGIAARSLQAVGAITSAVS
jgi:hypothetical protein